MLTTWAIVIVILSIILTIFKSGVTVNKILSMPGKDRGIEAGGYAFGSLIALGLNIIVLLALMGL